jgi:hypothetical protein
VTYNLKDANGYVSYGPSIAGMKALREEVESLPSKEYPELTTFVQQGGSDNPKALAKEAMKASDKIKNPPVRKTLINIIASARRAKQFLNLTD